MPGDDRTPADGESAEDGHAELDEDDGVADDAAADDIDDAVADSGDGADDDGDDAGPRTEDLEVAAIAAAVSAADRDEDGDDESGAPRRRAGRRGESTDDAEPEVRERRWTPPAELAAGVGARVRRMFASPLSDFHLVVTLTILLSTLGLGMVLSASSVKEYASFGDSYKVFTQQAVFAAAGIVLFYIALRLPIAFLRSTSLLAMIVSIGALALVLVPGIGVEAGGARRWLIIAGFTVQPSELVKLALCLWGAHILSTRRYGAPIKQLLVPVLPVAILVCGLIVMEKSLSMTVTVAIIVGALLWFAGLPMKTFVTMAIGGVATAAVLSVTADYRAARVKGLFGGSDPLGDAYQKTQGQFAIANGGLFGQGPGQSTAKWNYLPNAHNDFIFAIIAEELGLVGALTVVALFALLAWVGLRIARRNSDPFLRLLSAAITVLLTAQAAINIGYVIGMLPVTGIQLPLLSAGGTSMLVMLTMLGLLARAARHEPEAIAALAIGGESRVGRMLRLPLPRPYSPTRAERLQAKVDARPGRRAPHRDAPDPRDPRRPSGHDPRHRVGRDEGRDVHDARRRAAHEARQRAAHDPRSRAGHEARLRAAHDARRREGRAGETRRAADVGDERWRPRPAPRADGRRSPAAGYRGTSMPPEARAAGAAPRRAARRGGEEQRKNPRRATRRRDDE